MFQFLAAGAASVVVTDATEVEGAVSAADVILWSPRSDIARALPRPG